MGAIIWYPCTRFDWRVCRTIENINGGMAEWLKAAVLKTVELRGSVGSNPTSSAINSKGSFQRTTLFDCSKTALRVRKAFICDFARRREATRQHNSLPPTRTQTIHRPNGVARTALRRKPSAARPFANLPLRQKSPFNALPWGCTYDDRARHSCTRGE